jgi:prepilin peptidase CpaA
MLIIWGLAIVTLAFYLFKVVRTDLAHRRIENQDVMFILLCNVVIMVITSNYSVAGYSATILIIGFLFFVLGVWGGGDAKLIVSLSLAVPVNVQIDFIATVLMLGGGLAVMIIIISKLFKRPDWKRLGVPYAIPISLSGFYYIAHSLMSL